MKYQNQAARRDEVLFAFHQQCERPTTEQIIAWASRYPEFADDIRAHAAIAMDWNAAENAPALEPSDQLLARGRSRAMNAIYNAQAAARTKQANGGVTSFDQLMAAAGTSVPQLARTLEIERSVIVAMTTGRMRSPRERFRSAVASALQTVGAKIDAAFELALANPSMSHAKATSAPTIVVRTYDEIIRGSSMPPDKKAHWLEED